MNKLTITSAKLTGNPGASGWAQVHEFKPDDEVKLAKRGHLFAVVATGKQEEGVDSVIAGRELLSRLHEEYFGKLEGEPFNVLKSSVEKIIEEFKGSWGQVEVAAVAFLENVVYSAAGGGAQVTIFRNGMLAKILESRGEEVVSASGYPKEGDMLLLATKLFFEVVPNGVIKASLEVGEPENAAEAIAPSVHSRADSGSLGAVIIKFQAKTELAQMAEVKEVGVGQDVRIGTSGFAKLKNKISSLVKKLPERRIYVRGGQEEEVPIQRKKTMVTVGIVLLAILLISIAFGIRQKKINEEKGRYESRLTQAREEADEAIGLVTLNPERARELFASSRNIANKLKEEGVKDQTLNDLIKKLEGNQGAILGEYKVEPEQFLDLSILSDGLSGDDMSASASKIYVLDKKGKKVVGIALATKKTEVVAGPDQVGEAISLASYEDRVFILTSEGIFEIGEEKSKAIAKDWEGDVFPYAYAGNIYLLDTSARMIWRFAGVGKTFGSKQKWLGPGVAPDFSKTTSVTIDGSIWVLSASGKILNFNQGSPQNISGTGTFPEIISGDAIYSNEELSFVYILDKKGKRVVVLDKNAKYKAQYLSDKIAEVADLAVSEKEKKIILLSGSKIYSIAIKHL